MLNFILGAVTAGGCLYLGYRVGFAARVGETPAPFVPFRGRSKVLDANVYPDDE